MAAEVIAVYARWDVILNLIRRRPRRQCAGDRKERMAELASFQIMSVKRSGYWKVGPAM